MTWPIRGFFWIVVISFSFGVGDRVSVEVARPGGRVDAGLDSDRRRSRSRRDGGGELAGAQVANDALAHRQHALVADAHPAAARHQDAGVLGLLQDRAAAVALDVDAGAVEGDRAALAGDEGRDPELLGEQRQPALLVVGRDRVEQATRAAGERRPLGQVGDQRVEVGEVEDAVLVVVPRDEADRAAASSLRRSSRKIESGSLGATCSTTMSYGAERAGRSTPLSVDGVEVAQHPDHRGDPGAGGDEQQLVCGPRRPAARTRRPPARGGAACRAGCGARGRG